MVRLGAAVVFAAAAGPVFAGSPRPDIERRGQPDALLQEGKPDEGRGQSTLEEEKAPAHAPVPEPGILLAQAVSPPSTAVSLEVNAPSRASRPLVHRFRPLVHPFPRFARSALRRLSNVLPSKRHLPDHLSHREHWDYPGPFRWIPRSVTSFGWGKPRMLLGNQKNLEGRNPKPIGERGSFQISRYPRLPVPLNLLPLYIAFTTPGGYHFRLGARWDDVDAYVTLPSIAIKKID